MKKIGVLALQGAIREHIYQIEAVGCEAIAIKKPSDLEGIDGLILPGGESTTIRKLLDRFHLLEPIQNLAKQGLPMFGTCAGLILLAREIVGYEDPHLGVMNVVVERNSFGRQVDSFECDITLPKLQKVVPAVFIRAPHIISVDEHVEILAKYEERIVLARDRNFLGCSFHPELTKDVTIMQYFVELIRNH
ncbi:pyridoxal phosphate synthase yaaE subunit [Ureibacillus xyleni]|uniref:Pyridoxal 5'-phosphate synthase subunit PdxT n=1 Tax=Ureibacillus xyleni TaxID=614648 RepID=A0A285TUF9_9BACL|nr:pyridoxal 5'-phosphate synthase glutaminase subunit PdxT [Ureibacillus xyleni]SOC25196.1 pyridoxal phosphate synthase yaaE subunit [Ureibacillus xyleni]